MNIYLCVNEKNEKLHAGILSRETNFFSLQVVQNGPIKNNHLHRYHHGTWNVICIHLGIILNNDQHL